MNLKKVLKMRLKAIGERNVENLLDFEVGLNAEFLESFPLFLFQVN